LAPFSLIPTKRLTRPSLQQTAVRRTLANAGEGFQAYPNFIQGRGEKIPRADLECLPDLLFRDRP